MIKCWVYADKCTSKELMGSVESLGRKEVIISEKIKTKMDINIGDTIQFLYTDKYVYPLNHTPEFVIIDFYKDNVVSDDICIILSMDECVDMDVSIIGGNSVTIIKKEEFKWKRN